MSNYTTSQCKCVCQQYLALLQQNIQYSGMDFFLVVSVDLLFLLALGDSCLAGSDTSRDLKQSSFLITSPVRHMHNQFCYQAKFDKLT